MKLLLNRSTYGIYGMSPCLASVQWFLNARLMELPVGSAVHEIDVEIHVEEPRVAQEKPEYRDWLASLPKMSLRAKRGILKVEHRASGLAWSDASGDVSAAAFRGIVRELQEVVALAGERYGKRTGVRFDLVEAAFADACQAIPDDAAELQRVCEAARVRLAALPSDPWAGIPWDEYHADARNILDDPFFWSPIEGLGPIGNDVGADVLEAYKAWSKGHRPDDAIKMLRGLLDEWGTPEAESEAVIALPFVQIMVHGKAQGDAARAAIAAIEGGGDVDREEVRAARAKLLRVLRLFAR